MTVTEDDDGRPCTVALAVGGPWDGYEFPVRHNTAKIVMPSPKTSLDSVYVGSVYIRDGDRLYYSAKESKRANQ